MVAGQPELHSETVFKKEEHFITFIYACGGVCVYIHMWRSEDDMEEWLSPFTM